MRVLVSPASKHGATAEIGRFIADELRRGGIDVDVTRPEHVRDLTPYSAFIVGSAVYMGEWLESASTFVAEHADDLAKFPVWLFSSGPVGPSDPNQALKPGFIDELVRSTNAEGHELFGGRIQLSRLGRTQRLIARFVKVRDGDDRDWSRIGAWTGEITSRLNRPHVEGAIGDQSAADSG